MGANASYGSSVTTIGDLNEDGIPDVAVGAVAENSFTGSIYIHFMEGLTSVIAEESTDKAKCYWDIPPSPTWIRLEQSTQDGVSGILLTWTQYDADKLNIKIDDGTGNYPWKISNTLNDGHEFLANVASWQNIKIKPFNHCREGTYSNPVNLSSNPYGWYDQTGGGGAGSGSGAVLGAASERESTSAVPDTGSNMLVYLFSSFLLIVSSGYLVISGNARKWAIKSFENNFRNRI
jgi:hypothetical protein